MTDLINKLAATYDSKINTILSTLKDIHLTSNMVQRTLTFLSEENSILKGRIEQLETQTKRDREQITLLENKLEENQRLERLKGSENKKDLVQMVTKLSENLAVKLERSDIRDIIKTKKQKQERSTIILELTNTLIKTEILKAAKTYNNKNKTNKLNAGQMGLTAHSTTPIFLSENLTPLSSRLYFLARNFKEANQYKYCWTSYGKVYLRCDDDSPIVHITREAQLQQLPKKLLYFYVRSEQISLKFILHYLTSAVYLYLFYVLVAANNCVSNLKLNKHKLTQLKQKLHKQSLHSTQNIHINSLQKDNKPQIPNLKIILSFKLISKRKGHHTLHLTYIKNG